MVDEQIRARGIRDGRVLAAMVEVPRERFLPPEQGAQAFSDAAVAIGLGQTISQPYMVAAMTVQLELQQCRRVLEVGTGSGYQAAVLSRLVEEVYTVERIGRLQEQARALLEELGCHNIQYRVGDGSLGWPEAAPFDGIIVTAAPPAVPRPLLDQLAEGGRLVVPVGDRSEQVLTTIRKSAGRTVEMPGMPCRFVRLIGVEGWPEASESRDE
jgi:protein-L-isoaspartate(D-aspartate) O-methyltransferase